jgi:hypothetical protein
MSSVAPIDWLPTMEAVAPARRAALHLAVGVGHDDHRGKVVALGAEAVSNPRADAGQAQPRQAGGQHVLRGRVIERFVVTAANDGELVGMLLE